MLQCLPRLCIQMDLLEKGGIYDTLVHAKFGLEHCTSRIWGRAKNRKSTSEYFCCYTGPSSIATPFSKTERTSLAAVILYLSSTKRLCFLSAFVRYFIWVFVANLPLIVSAEEFRNRLIFREVYEQEFNVLFFWLTVYIQTKYQDRRFVGLKDRVGTNGRTDGHDRLHNFSR